MRLIHRCFAALTLGVMVALAGGCTPHYAVVRTEGAPLYRDPGRTVVVTYMDKLGEVYLGYGEPDGDPVCAYYRGREGYADRGDLLVFASEDEAYHAARVRWARREVVLAEKPWPPEIKRAIRRDRLRQGMTREMAVLAWGMPTSVVPGEDGRERWEYEHRVWDLHTRRTSTWGPDLVFGAGFYHRYHFGAIGFGYPARLERVERTYVPRTVHRTVHLEDGTVVGWE